MSLFSNIFRSNKSKDVYKSNNLDLLNSLIEENFSLSEKYFDKLSYKEQLDSISILKDNRFRTNVNLFVNDFEKFISHSKYKIIDNKILSDFCNSYSDKQYKEVDVFLSELSDFLIEKYDISNHSFEEHYQIYQILQEASSEIVNFEEYFFSNIVIRYFKEISEKNSSPVLELFRTTPIWLSTHMYLDIINSLKKSFRDTIIYDSCLYSQLKTITNEQKEFFRPFRLIN